ncbi:hypothetical protein [Arthrobacter sp. fls2-241-R2A-172]
MSPLTNQSGEKTGGRWRRRRRGDRRRRGLSGVVRRCAWWARQP